MLPTHSAFDVPENGLCDQELDTCPSDQNLLLEEALDALRRIGYANWADVTKIAHARSMYDELTEMYEAMGIYTPTPYHQTGGTRPAQNNNKEE